MEKKCSNPNCLHVNKESSHYCVNCGEPLEKSGWILPRPVRYRVVSESDYNEKVNQVVALEKERNRLRKQIGDSWGYKFEMWLKDYWVAVFWTFLIVILIILTGWFFKSCDFGKIFEMANNPNKEMEKIQVLQDMKTLKYGIYNKETEAMTVPYEYDSISHKKLNTMLGSDGVKNYMDYYCLYRDGKIRIANASGNLTIDTGLDSISRDFSGLFVMFRGGKRGLFDTFGNQIIPCEYQYVIWQKPPRFSSFEHPGVYVGNIIPVKVDDNSGWELYNRQGRKIRGQHYAFAIQTGDPRLIKVREKTNDYHSYGLVDESGQEIMPCKYYTISAFGNERAWVREKYSDSWSLIDNKGNRLMTLAKGYYPSVFSYGLAAITEKDKVAYCDVSGKFVIPMKYERVYNSNGSFTSPSFYNGKARVSFNGKPGYINKDGMFSPDTN